PKVSVGSGDAKPVERRLIVLHDPLNPVDCGVYEREGLAAGTTIAGPAAISEYASTTLLFEGDTLKVAPGGELVVSIGGGVQ
ncbi:MAG TPA: hypothetical protein VG271_17725, partial [Beijerinckiaceae bacterium]|nr:hypothetical protein [Beijerinckiaceae bacterium]